MVTKLSRSFESCVSEPMNFRYLYYYVFSQLTQGPLYFGIT